MVHPGGKLPILQSQVFKRRRSKGKIENIFLNNDPAIKVRLKAILMVCSLSLFFPRGEVKKVDAKPYISSATFKMLNCS